MFSAFWAVLAFVAVLIFASGGSARRPAFDLAFTGAGIAFIVTLVIAAMLSMSYKENAEHLGKGSGVNLSSARRPRHGFGGWHRGQRPDSRTAPTPHPATSPLGRLHGGRHAHWASRARRTSSRARQDAACRAR